MGFTLNEALILYELIDLSIVDAEKYGLDVSETRNSARDKLTEIICQLRGEQNV